MRPEELRDRTKTFALQIVRFFRSLPRDPDLQILGKQLLRSGTSIGANYRAACRGRSHAEFTAKIGVVVEEADETMYWLELIAETHAVNPRSLDPLLNEARELTAIFNAARQTARTHPN